MFFPCISIHHPDRWVFSWDWRECHLVATVVVVLETVGRAILVGVVLVGAQVALVVLVVHVLGTLLGLMMGALAVVGVHA